jgi:amino acid transporter
VLSEVRDPVRTIKRAAPFAMLSVTVVYLLVNVAYFAVVSKSDILNSRQIIAALFFRNLFGPTLEKALSAFIALSLLGNILAGQFAQARVIQELGREGILPYPSYFSSNKPFNAPLSAISTQYLVNVLLIVIPPPGDIYLFMINTSSYSSALINAFVSLGLLLLYTPTFRAWDWNPPVRAPRVIIVLFCLSNTFLILVPLIPPTDGSRVYESLPYWLHALVAISASLIGTSYWYIYWVWLPSRNGYRLERLQVLQEDGVSRKVFRKIPMPRV